jgi:hypothetical protein
LYALSTLAQTCAALAAFVGAVGIFRLQVLREQHREAERELRQFVSQAGVTFDMGLTPTKTVLERLDATVKKFGPEKPTVKPAVEGRAVWETFKARMVVSRRAIVFFEAWNLLVIGLALVGFNYVPALAASPVTFWAIWLTALGTVGVTGYAVYAWTRG